MTRSEVLTIENIHKSYGPTRALAGISFHVDRGEILGLLGPSGCGKSTALHIIAGIEVQDEGRVSWEAGSLEGVPPHKRDFGLMFQDYALFPHMNTYDNVAFGLRMQRMQPGDVRQRVDSTLELVGLSGFEARQVDQLSGGERQRVALARTLAPRPRLLMLDEPLGNLDRTLKERLMLELPLILRQLEQTAIYVTHDQEEAFAIADRIVVMSEGRVAQIGKPEAIYRQPASLFVARFLGLDNLLKGRAVSSAQGREIDTPVGRLPSAEPLEGEVTVLLRPEAANLDGEGDLRIAGKLIERSFRGSLQRAVLEVNGDLRLSFDFLSSEELPGVGGEMTVHLDARRAVQVLK